MAKGFGTLTAQKPKLEPIEVHGVWKDGVWQAVFVRDLKVSEKGALEFKPGGSLNVAFAAWDGSKKDRNGQKAVSVWDELVLEK